MLVKNVLLAILGHLHLFHVCLGLHFRGERLTLVLIRIGVTVVASVTMCLSWSIYQLRN